MKKPKFYGSFRKSCLVVANYVYGSKGVWAYEIFEFINAHYFDGRLPWPQIIWGLTPHGGCVAWASTTGDKSRPPIINLHPSLLKPTEKDEPWKIPKRWFGPSLVFDTLLHECIHIHIKYNLGGQRGRSSHDCKRWIRQVNRLAPLLGFDNVRAGGTKCVRVADRSLPRTVRGKVATKVVRQTTGNIPFRAVAGFPDALRVLRGEADSHYSPQRLPKGAPRLGVKRMAVQRNVT